MKVKRPTCSTGHDTGVLQRRGLHEILEDSRTRKDAKKHRQMVRRRLRARGKAA